MRVYDFERDGSLLGELAGTLLRKHHAKVEEERRAEAKKEAEEGARKLAEIEAEGAGLRAKLAMAEAQLAKARLAAAQQELQDEMDRISATRRAKGKKTLDSPELRSRAAHALAQRNSVKP